MNTITGADIATAILMWIVAICYFVGMIIAYRLRYHLDVDKFADPDTVRRSIKMIAFPPADVLTERGQKRRSLVIGFWSFGALAFAVLAIWKSVAPH